MTPLSADLRRVQIVCGDERLCRLLENELAYLGMVPRSFPAPPRPEGLCLLIWDGDSLPAEAGIRHAGECGCPLLLFARETQPIPAAAGDAVFLRRPFALTELHKALQDLTETVPLPGAAPDTPARDRRLPDPRPPILSVQNGTVTVEGRALPLTDGEWAILERLYARRGHPVPRDELASLLGGGGNSVDVYICRLRTKIEKPLGRRIIWTVRGKGYVLKTEI